jgi:hypothetical protein
MAWLRWANRGNATMRELLVEPSGLAAYGLDRQPGREYVIRAPAGNSLRVLFQDGKPEEVGINGVTTDTLLAVLIDHHESQSELHPDHNALHEAVLPHLRAALDALREARKPKKAKKGQRE